jgi:dolichol-phosphate mannosyltransferase
MSKVDCFVTAVISVPEWTPGVESYIREVHQMAGDGFAHYELLLLLHREAQSAVVAVEELLTQLPYVRVIQLTQTLDPELALVAGLDSAIGDFVVTMTAEVDPWSKVPEMIELARSGHDVVRGTTDTASGRGFIYRLGRSCFYWLCSTLMPVTPSPGSTTFRVLSRRCVNALTRIRTRYRYFTMLVEELGLPSVDFEYQALKAPRREGVIASIGSGVSFIVHNSFRPLRLVSGLGMIGSFLSLGYAIYVFVVNALLAQITEGWTTLSLFLSGLFFMLFTILAIFAEYLLRIMDQTSERPLYHVWDEKNSSVTIAHQERLNVLSESEETPVSDQ